ncbi:MAG: protein kinase [Polyangiaceae bacterium]
MLACPRCRTSYPDDLSECPDDGSTLLPADMLPAADVPLEPGSMIGEYRIEKKLGAGTFGDVYAGEQPLIGKRVAIKLLHRKFSSDAEIVSRFVAEARAVNRIRHRNIIDIFSFGMVDDERHYFVMELLDGLTLRDLLDREPRLPLEKALPILRGIASGLDAAHEAGVTHRDLKPDNVFLAVERDKSYFPKLLDFGVAKLLGEDLAHKTATGMAIGTPRYMSPEQCRGKKIDHRADIYSLGVLVHEMLTGRPLFEAETAMDLLLAHTSDTPRRMSQLCPDLPPELDEPVLAMLAKRPKDRPDSAGAAISALAQRARETALGSTLPASSKSLHSSPEAPAQSSDPSVERLAPGDATVAVRKRGPVITPHPHQGVVQVDARTVEVAAISAAESIPVSLGDLEGRTDRTGPPTAHSRGAEGPGSTEIARTEGGDTLMAGPVGASSGITASGITGPDSTLRSPITVGDRGKVETTASMEGRASTTPRRGASFWAALAVGVLALAGVAFALFRSSATTGQPPSPEPETHAAPPRPDTSPAGSAADPSPEPPASPVPSVAVIPDPTPTADPSASAEATAPHVAAPHPAPAPTAGKPIAKPKDHDDIERPPELSPH